MNRQNPARLLLALAVFASIFVKANSAPGSGVRIAASLVLIVGTVVLAVLIYRRFRTKPEDRSR